MKAQDLFEDVARYLTDFSHEYETESYVHWEKEDLLSYFKYAVAIVATANKDKFTKTVMSPLVEGPIQSIPEDCSEVRDILGVIGADGRLSSYTRKTSMDFIRAFKLSTCRAKVSVDAPYQMESWGFIEGTEYSILVDPPVPQGTSGKLMLTCFSQPNINTELDDVRGLDAFRAVIFELMLYYAWGIDTESISSRERSAVHWANAMAILNSSVKQPKTKANPQ